ncbi:MAG TPA: hypothetical protein VHG93_11620 [Longimicrobium sp.]|nr:hypothetical protein [Longimicrobium sp.]
MFPRTLRRTLPALVLLPVVALGACGDGGKPTDPSPPGNPGPSPNPPAAGTGQIVFWTDNAALAPITVNVNGESGSIAAAHATPPACGAAGAYTVTLPAGQHAFTGANGAGVAWNGSVTATAGTCTAWRLYTSTPPAPATGQIVFWTDNAALTPITVNVNGLSGSITAAHAGAPACGAAGAYTVTLPAGSQPFTGSNAAGLAWNGNVTVTAGGCTPWRLFSTGTPPPPAPGTGQVAFWTDNAGLVPISVTVNGLSGSITAAHAAAPSCGVAGAYTVTLPAGSHGFTASNGAGVRWSGSVNVTAGGCSRLRLYQTSTPPTPPPPSPGTGRVMFWTSTAALTPISVSVGGLSGAISSAYASTPSCGAAGTFTVTLAPGTYAYTAQSGGGSRWSGSVSVTAGACLALRLTGSTTPPPPTTPAPGCSERVTIAPMQPGQSTGWFPSRRWAGLDYRVSVGTFQYDGNERQYNVYVRNRYVDRKAWVSVGFRVGTQPTNTTDRLGTIHPGGDDDSTWFIEPYGRTSYLLVDAVRVGTSDSGDYYCPAPPAP